VVADPIDLRHQGARHVIGSYLLQTEDGPAIFDCGPTTCIGTLKVGLGARGVELRDVRHLLLSHIHLDHAGATGALVREHPELQVHVSGKGAPHLVDPTRLEASARRLYGDAFDELWGELTPVPEENVRIVGDEVVGLECFPTPGHASHHVCYLDPDGTLYAGDACGVRIQPSRFVMPPTPPPDVDVEAWNGSLDEIERRGPARLALVHFGVAEDPGRHLTDLRARLAAWAAVVAAGATEQAFVESILEELEADEEPERDTYEHAMPLRQSYAGLKRYFEKRDSS
jgi:glyoxylase-like metal-dependent hydrolase (beta-lactamase superfamily II)